MSSDSARFGDLFLEPQRNGLTRPKKVRGVGLPMVNMGELFAYPRIHDIPMDLVPVDRKEHHYLLETGDLLFARQSLVLSGAGQCSIFLGNGAATVFESHLIRCRLDARRSNPLFYFYFFRSPEGRRAIEAIVEQGAGASGIRGSDLVNVQVPNPPKRIQDEIAEILGSIDDRITLLRETNATLEAIAQALFKSWFVDFDPVRAKMEGRTPEGMDEATAALFPDGFETSELGEVPRGWRVGKLGDVAALKGGKQLSKEAFSNSAPNPVFGGAGVMGHTAQRNATDFVITVGRVGAYCGQFFWHIGNAWVNNNASHVVPSRKISSEWLLLWLKSVNMDVIKKGAAQPFVSNGDIAKLSMIHPPIELIDAFGALVAPMFARSQLLVQQSVELASVRDTLLPRLISGQLRLSEAQAATEAALGGTLSV